MFLGSPGTGKTHLAIGLGIRACQSGHGVALVWRCYCGKQGTMRDGVSRQLMTTAEPPPAERRREGRCADHLRGGVTAMIPDNSITRRRGPAPTERLNARCACMSHRERARLRSRAADSHPPQRWITYR